MHYYTGFTTTSTRNWLHDNRMFLDAYYAANRDEALKAEVHQLEVKYIRMHLAELVGEKDADRILNERGF